MNRKYTKEALLKMSVIEVYKLVLERKISRFPAGFWIQPEVLETGRLYVKFMIEEILKWNEEDIKEKLSQKTFTKNKLSGMLQYVFNNSPYNAINAIYPNKFKEWELKSTPQNFWTLETGIEATKWLIEEKLKWTDEDIRKKISQKIFIENKLSGMIWHVFNGSPYFAINSVYPNRFKPWEFKNVSRDYWTVETGTEATKWLIEQKLKWTDRDIKERLSAKIFKANSLDAMLQHVFNHSPYNAVNAIYPDKFKKEDLKSYRYNTIKSK